MTNTWMLLFTFAWGIAALYFWSRQREQEQKHLNSLKPDSSLVGKSKRRLRQINGEILIILLCLLGYSLAHLCYFQYYP